MFTFLLFLDIDIDGTGSEESNLQERRKCLLRQDCHDKFHYVAFLNAYSFIIYLRVCRRTYDISIFSCWKCQQVITFSKFLLQFSCCQVRRNIPDYLRL
ncbi:hypothetical protein R1flu_002752 [Riccia fluitans]|uniref:Uncharacterized protein n=1 Tax=Riccia fluitans TaxID=41844 RepID=A0ABD1YAE8_9MARC